MWHIRLCHTATLYPMATTKAPAKHAGGRKPLLSPEVHREYFTARGMGLSVTRAAGWAGVSESVIRNWLIRGEAAAKVAAGKRSAHDQLCVEFLREHTKVDHEEIMRCETILNLSMGLGTGADAWQAASDAEKDRAVSTAKFKLTHRYPGEYSTRAGLELTGPDGGPIDLALDAEAVFAKMLKAQVE